MSDPFNGLRFGSAHSGGFNMAFCDGSVHSIIYEIDPQVHAMLSDRGDGQVSMHRSICNRRAARSPNDSRRVAARWPRRQSADRSSSGTAQSVTSVTPSTVVPPGISTIRWTMGAVNISNGTRTMT